MSTIKQCDGLTTGKMIVSKSIVEWTPIWKPLNGHAFSMISGSTSVKIDKKSLSPLTVPRIR